MIVISAFLKRVQRKDSDILLIFNNSIRCKLLDLLMPYITYLGSVTFCAMYCLIFLFIPSDFIHSLAINTAKSLIIATITAHIIKVTVNRIRPFLSLNNLNIKKIGIDSYSFPSGHTTSAFCIAIMFSLYFPIAAPVAIALSCGVGISRMYIGVHYPTDVMVGMLLGTICSFLVFLF